MKKINHPVTAFIGVLIGSVFLASAGVGYADWKLLPQSLAIFIVNVATFYAFIKLVNVILNNFHKK